MSNYIESGRWKCEDSPTGAHHWVQLAGDVFKCKHCKNYRLLSNSFSRSHQFVSKPLPDIYYRVFDSLKEIRRYMKEIEEANKLPLPPEITKFSVRRSDGKED